MSEVVAMFAVAAVLAIYGSFKYFSAGNSEWSAITIRANAIQSDVNALSERTSDYESRFNALGNKISILDLKAAKFESEMIEARGAIARKRQAIVIKTAIPVSIVERDLPPVPRIPPNEPIKALRKSLAK